MAELNIKQKKELARLLYVKENLTQKEIAARVQVTEMTLSKWVNKEKWEDLKVNFIISKEQEIRRIFIQIRNLNNAIEERPNGYATSAESDTLTKLSAAARNLMTETNVGQVIDVFIEFNDYLREIIPIEKAQEIGEYQDKFVKSLL